MPADGACAVSLVAMPRSSGETAPRPPPTTAPRAGTDAIKAGRGLDAVEFIKDAGAHDTSTPERHRGGNRYTTHEPKVRVHVGLAREVRDSEIHIRAI